MGYDFWALSRPYLYTRSPFRLRYGFRSNDILYDTFDYVVDHFSMRDGTVGSKSGASGVFGDCLSIFACLARART